MPRAGRSTLILFLGGAAFFIDMFLHWTRNGDRYVGAPASSGWEFPLVNQAGLLALALALVELVRIRGVWWTGTSSLLSFFLAAAAGLLTIGGLIHIHWGFERLKLSAFGYGAWLGLALAGVLLAGAAMRLLEHRVE